MAEPCRRIQVYKRVPVKDGIQDGMRIAGEGYQVRHREPVIYGNRLDTGEQ